MDKTIWLINHYASRMLFNKGGRHYYFAKYLERAGFHPVIFCANIVNNRTEERCIETEELWSVKEADDIHTPFVYVKARKYKGNGSQRVLNMFDFYRNVKKAALEYSREFGKPDIILASSVHPLTLVAGIQLAKKFGVKCICEVRDLWPEAIVVYSKRIKKTNLLARLMYAGEKWIYKKADAVIFTQEGGPDYVCEKGWDNTHGGPIKKDKLYHINNGVDLESFDSNSVRYIYKDIDLDNPDYFKVVYAGSIRRINNLGIILDAAKCVADERIKFIIFGDGDELEYLKKRVIEEKIENVIFKGRVNKQYIPSIDMKADLNLVHWEMSPLLRVGESYNKAFEYFAAGKPVFYTIRPGYSIVEKYGCGVITSGFTPSDIASGIQSIARMNNDELAMMSVNARKTAEIYDYKNLTHRLIDVINTCEEK